MNSIIQQITDWLKGLLVSGIMNNLTNTFSSVNDQVGQIATEVGQTPSSFLPAVFNMVRNLSETVIIMDVILRGLGMCLQQANSVRVITKALLASL